jgi:hypothetical protein
VTAADERTCLDREALDARCDALEAWIAANGWSGFDPFDIIEPRWVQRTLYADSKVVQLCLAYPLSASLKFAPQMWRAVLRVPKRLNAKGLGLLARGHLARLSSSGDPRHERRSRELLDWLLANPSPGYRGLCWGYPFDWQSRVFIPKGTPSSVVSFAVGDALLTAYQQLGDERYLEGARSVCEFFLRDLRVTTEQDGTWCFSYTPLDTFQVHNANLFVAQLLVRVGVELSDARLIEAGLRAADFTRNQQHADGSIDYWGRSQQHEPPHRNDHYHAGFEIRSFLAVHRATGDSKYLEAAQRYYSYYRHHLLERTETGFVPRFTPQHLYPIDIHSCAEAIYLNALMLDVDPHAGEILKTLVANVLTRMAAPDGSFYYRIYRVAGFERTDKSRYLRWGQAWMFLALSSLVAALRPSASGNTAAA